MEIQGNELRIICPPGMEIDREHSTLECIKFKPVAKRWRDDYSKSISGYVIDYNSIIQKQSNFINSDTNYNLFATEKQAKSALAMAQISQIMANDERFGGVVTDEEFEDEDIWIYSINRDKNMIKTYQGTHGIDHFLSFHTPRQRDLFLKENEDLIRDYLMLD